jgi:hypothetical protein
MFFHASSPLLSARKAKGTILYSDIGSLPPVTQVFWPEQAFRTRRRPFGTARGRCRRGAGEGAVARSVQTINKPITHGRVCRGLEGLLKRTVKRTVAGTKKIAVSPATDLCSCSHEDAFQWAPGTCMVHRMPLHLRGGREARAGNSEAEYTPSRRAARDTCHTGPSAALCPGARPACPEERRYHDA